MRLNTGYTFRLNVLPKCYSEYPLFLFTSLIIPVIYWFETYIVLRTIFALSSNIYYPLFLLSLFEFHNVEGNFLAVILCDTSIKGRLMPDESQNGVKYCTECDTLTPPRSYHCPSCDTCILKRDHHCIFTGCCIGHYNHRYFMNFMLHITLSVLMAIPFNIYFLWDVLSFNGFSFIASLLFPIVLFIMDLGPDNLDAEQIYLILFTIQLGGCVFCATWLFFHIRMILKGTIVHEFRKCINFYDMGPDKNIKTVFGERWYLTWISPLISSELPCDGITFPVKNDSNAL